MFRGRHSIFIIYRFQYRKLEMIFNLEDQVSITKKSVNVEITLFSPSKTWRRKVEDFPSRTNILSLKGNESRNLVKNLQNSKLFYQNKQVGI